MAKVGATVTLIIFGLMFANALTHPVGMGVLIRGAEGLSKQTGNQLLGHTA